MGKDDEVFCTVCNLILIDGDNQIQCEGFCQDWVHTKCVNISDDDFEKICDLGDTSHWFCASCLPGVRDIFTKVKNPGELLNLSGLVDKLVNIVKGLVSDNLEINKKLDNVISENLGLKTHVSNIETELTTLSSNKYFLSCQAKSKSNAVKSALDKEDKIDDQTYSQVVKSSLDKDQRNSSEPVSNVKSVSPKESDSSPEPSSSPSIHKHLNPNQNVQVHQHREVSWRKAGGERSRKSHSHKPIIGSNVKKSSLKIAEKQKFVFVSRFSPDTECDEIVKYLKEESVEGAKCEKLQTRFSSYSSFKVSVSENYFDKVLKSEFWPIGLFVKEFRQSRQSGTGPNNKTSRSNQVASQTFLGKQQA